MGPYYNFVLLGGKFYLEYQDESTGWQMKVFELTDSDMELVHGFETKQEDEKRKFFSGLVKAWVKENENSL